MGILSRAILREIFFNALLGTVLFTFVLFLEQAGKTFELLVRSSASLETTVYLFGLILPFALTFTLPLGALVGILVGLSRMSSDGEIVGMRAAGVPGRNVMAPVAAVALLFMAITAACSLWLTPLSIRETYKVLNRLIAEELTAEIQPRVFQEQFPNTILYVGDVVPGPVERWRNVFLADLRAPEERPGARDKAEGPHITLAREAVAAADLKNNRIQLHMLEGSTYEAGKDPIEYYSTAFPTGDQVLQASRPGEVRASRPYREIDTGPLFREAKKSREAAIELHQRLALPFAAVLLALVGIPLGVSARKAGKSAAVVVTVFLAFLYYMSLISLISVARQGTLPVALAVWTPNVVFAAVGAILFARLEQPGDRDLVGTAKARFEALWTGLHNRLSPGQAGVLNGGRLGRVHLMPQILDTYILSTFLFYFVLLLASFVLMTEVYTFFELLGDIIRNKIAMSRVFTYLVFLAPKLVYDSTPISVLVAVLVTFGVMTKHNEVTAFKASGVSLHRMVLPVTLASLVLSAGLFAFDYQLLPEANRRQDAIRAEIKGRAPQTYLRPDRKWISGQGPRIYYYKYFDPNEAVMVGVSVYELDLKSFRLKKQIAAERAHWDAALRTWIFENGWKREMAGPPEKRFEKFQVAVFSELDEQPNYFMKEVIQDKQMNFRQLADYIEELRQSGFDTVHLRVQLQKKFSVPLFAFIMALISTPFAFLTGNRGAMAGVGVSLGIAVAYWAVGQLFEQIGNINQLPAALAAWSPDAIFSLAAIYLMTRMRT